MIKGNCAHVILRRDGCQAPRTIGTSQTSVEQNALQSKGMSFLPVSRKLDTSVEPHKTHRKPNCTAPITSNTNQFSAWYCCRSLPVGPAPSQILIEVRIEN